MKECSASPFSKEHAEKRATAFQAILDECSAFESLPVGIFNKFLGGKWFILSALFFVSSFYLDLTMVNYSYCPYFQLIEINAQASVESKDEEPNKEVESAVLAESIDARHALHLPVFDLRGRCKLSGCNGKSSLRCSSCGIHLCLSKTRNCFFLFHSTIRNEWTRQVDCFFSRERT